MTPLLPLEMVSGGDGHSGRMGLRGDPLSVVARMGTRRHPGENEGVGGVRARPPPPDFLWNRWKRDHGSRSCSIKKRHLVTISFILLKADPYPARRRADRRRGHEPGASRFVPATEKGEPGAEPVPGREQVRSPNRVSSGNEGVPPSDAEDCKRTQEPQCFSFRTHLVSSWNLHLGSGRRRDPWIRPIAARLRSGQQ